MDTKYLSLVVGAGASRELGLPTGAELKKTISSLLDIRFEHGYQQKTGDHNICEALRLHVRELGQHDINPHLHSAWRIRDAMPQAISIDNFIDTHQGDSQIELCGKLAIVKSILDAEKRSLLYVDPMSSHDKFDFLRTDVTWLNPFFRILTENCRPAELKERLSRVSLIIFNYDRCIEHYLHSALQNYFSLGSGKAAELVNGMDIYHPYGTVGQLPWQTDTTNVGFGAELGPTQLLSIARQIKTFTEGTDPDSSEIAAIRNATRTSKRLLFLGFAFHRLNMQLLQSSEKVASADQSKRIFATAMSISKNDASEISEELLQLGNCSEPNIHVRSDLACHTIFSEFARGLSVQ